MTFTPRKTRLSAAIAVLLCLLITSGAQARWGEEVPLQSLSRPAAEPMVDVLLPMMHAQNRRSEYRSRGEVMREVKRRYDARVLKISLNKKREIYNVRVLMPSGKVRNIQVSARR